MSLSFPVAAVSALAAVLLLAGCASLVADRREAGWVADTPPIGQFVEVEGRRVHLIEAGQPRGTAPDLVLIHGANGNLRDFTFDLVSRLEDEYRIIALDRPGLGYTDGWGEADSDPRLQARVLREAALQLGLSRPVVLGHSYGGAVALGWALQNPEDTAALVLISAASIPWEGELGLWYRINDTALGGPARTLVAAFAPEWAVDRAFEGVFDPDAMPEGYNEYTGAGLPLRRASQENNNRQVNRLRDYLAEMRPGYPALPMPIELVHGEADTTVGLEIHSRRFAAEVPAANLTVIPGAGHMPHHAHSDVVIEAIRRATRRAGGGS
ncbi:MAG: alpha/beta fold hydrolase [Pararhodobacter sp.]